MIGWPVAKVYKAPGQLASRERRPGATAHVGDGGGVDDRRRPRQRRSRVRLVAAEHVHRGDGPRRHRRLGRRPRLRVPAACRASCPRRSRTFPSCPPSPACGSTAVRSTATRSRSAPPTRSPSSSSSTSISSQGSWEGLQEGGIFVHEDPARGPRARGRLDVGRDVPERRRARRSPSPGSTATPTSSATG